MIIATLLVQYQVACDLSHLILLYRSPDMLINQHVSNARELIEPKPTVTERCSDWRADSVWLAQAKLIQGDVLAKHSSSTYEVIHCIAPDPKLLWPLNSCFTCWGRKLLCLLLKDLAPASYRDTHHTGNKVIMLILSLLKHVLPKCK